MTSPQSSHESAEAAGWGCREAGVFVDLGPQKALSWLRPSILWRSRNDVIARWFGDPVDDIRRRWVGPVQSDHVIPHDHESFSFLLLGDTGEGDRSQYAVIPGALKIGEGTDFMVIASDVIASDSIDLSPESPRSCVARLMAWGRDGRWRCSARCFRGRR